MPARRIGGTSVANEIKAELAGDLEQLRAAGVQPGLAVILAGDSSDSKTYLHSIHSTLTNSIRVEEHVLPESTSTNTVLRLIAGLNARDDVDGILVLSPLPPQVDGAAVSEAVSPDKDVDGIHPQTIGFLAVRRPRLLPCTAAAVLEILKRSNIQIEGREAVVIGRSEIVGRPLAILLTNTNATVALCHTRTKDLPSVCRRADIVVGASGKPGMITRDFIKPGATVIDIGINKITSRAEFDRFFGGDKAREQSFAAHGYVVMGDVHPEVFEVAGALTPVPGGVGPVTLAMLMANTVKAAIMRRHQLQA